MTVKPCTCRACAELLDECGETLFPMDAKKLLIEGWAGLKSPAERAYIRAHRRSTRKPPARRTPSPPERAAQQSTVLTLSAHPSTRQQRRAPTAAGG